MRRNWIRFEKTMKATACTAGPEARGGSWRGAAVLAGLLLAAGPQAGWSQCSPGWTLAFGEPGATKPAFAVEAFAIHQGQLVAAGGFEGIGSFGLTQVTDGVACWDGTVWNRMDNGFNGDPFDAKLEALAVYNGVLYGAGQITTTTSCTTDPCPKPTKVQHALVRFAGSCPGGSWDVAGPRATAARVGQMAVYGGLLYIVGHLSTQAGFGSAHAVSFNGSDYGTLGGGLAGRSLGSVVSAGAYGVVAVSSAESAASGLPKGVYVVGSFSNAWNIDNSGTLVSVPGTDGIALWDPATGKWSHVSGGGLVQPTCDPGVVCDPAALFTIEKYDDGTGLALYVGGRFDEIGPGVMVNNVARLDSSGWSPVQGPTDPGDGVEIGYAATMTVHKRSLVVGGQFHFAGGESARNVALWNETGWSPLNGGIGEIDVEVKTLASYDEGTGAGPFLFAGGLFQTVMNTPPVELTAVNIARWEGAPCPGDINFDGVVDEVDLDLLQAAWGSCPAPCPADLDGDGQVGITDFLDLLAAFGRCPC